MRMEKETMNKTEIKRDFLRPLLDRMTADELDRLVEALPMEQVSLMGTPTTGLIMAKIRDCFDTEFYLGEVLTTRAEVRYADFRAQATVMGFNPKASLVAAVLDVMAMSGQLAILDGATEASKPAIERLCKEEQTASRFKDATRVQFESMAEES